MLNVKEATQTALNYFEDLYGDNDAIADVLLEEIEQHEQDGTPYWLVTVGFTDVREGKRLKKKSGPLQSLSPSGPPRRYKRFKINAETGEVVAMKIRSVNNA